MIFADTLISLEDQEIIMLVDGTHVSMVLVG